MPTREFIAGVLANGRFSDLIDRREDEWFEAKENHEFELGANARHRVELSKDVSALANHEGGFVLIGLRTEPVPEEHTDRVTELGLLPTAEFNAGQFSGVIAEYVFPVIKGLEVKWIESTETPGLGLGCITVPAQSADDQPFLLKRVYEGDTEIQQIVFGIARRVGSSNVPMTLEQLHRAVLQGKASVPERLTRMEAQLTEILARLGAAPAPQGPETVPADALAERIRRVFGDA